MNKIDKISQISYPDFLQNHLKLNYPCIVSGLTECWKSKTEWVNLDGKPNFEFLQTNFGSTTVPIADCNSREYNSQQKITMKLEDYINYWKSLPVHKNDTSTSQCLYLKDWHFSRDHPCYEAYVTPDYFHSDWLNEFCKEENDDYKFVYMGPKGTWTPLHADVFGSYSWSANICGRKRWLLFPPGQEKRLVDKNNKLLYLLEDGQADQLGAEYLDVVQESGETIFVPSGWYHQVHNLDDTISINHNWFNGCNILHIWRCLETALADVENEISDCRDTPEWEEQCQVILRVHHGINYFDFLKILKSIYKSRLQKFDATDNLQTSTEIIDDILAIHNVCETILQKGLPIFFQHELRLFYEEVKEFISSYKSMYQKM